MERPDEEIYEFVNGMWPDLGFTVVDLRKPNGERFRQLLICFLELFYGKINFSKINFSKYTRHPEMFSHNESAIALYREVNTLLKKLRYLTFRYGDIINPSPVAVREVLNVLLNFAAFMESSNGIVEEAKAQALSVAQRQREAEKQLCEEKKHLEKCKQVAEERKMHEAELHSLVSSKRQTLRQLHSELSKVEEEANNESQSKQIMQQKIDQATIIFNQADAEHVKAKEEVVLDPESLLSELGSCQKEKDALHEEYINFKERLPVLEQQLQERTLQLEKHKEMMNQLTEFRARETQVMAELHQEEAQLKKLEKEVQELETNLNREQCTVESKRRILDQNKNEMMRERISHEEHIMKLKLALSDESKRKQNHALQMQNMEKELQHLREQLELGQRGLKEAEDMQLELDHQFQAKVKERDRHETELFREMEDRLETAIRTKFHQTK